MRKNVHEVLKETAKLNTKKAKIELLQKADCPALKDILRINFDDTIVSLLPKGSPPYRKDDAPDGLNFSTLHKNMPYFAYFFEGIHSGMNQIKRESQYIRLLESVNPEDAEVMIAAVNKDLKFKGLTKKLVNDAFPNLIRK
jgi:hypothetical protein